MIEENLKHMLSSNGQKLFSLCYYAVNADGEDSILNRKFLGRLHLEAQWMEETLDRHGAVHNAAWLPFREVIADTKILSSACFDLLHLENAAPSYKLLNIDNDFSGDIRKYLRVFSSVLTAVSREILKWTEKYHMKFTVSLLTKNLFEEVTVPGKLKSTRKTRRGKDIHHKAIYLATAFLNVSPDFHIIEAAHCLHKDSVKDCIPDHINEENLRLLKARFHNLQSTYDTYLYKTDLEKDDTDLLTLRGHISIIFHLLCSATELSHYYERHILNADRTLIRKPFIPLQKAQTLDIIINFFIRYTNQYFSAAKDLCKTIIKQYAEVGEISLPIPIYRGFHVRPSTLVAKIVLHYGSDVTMRIGDEVYDASSPLELFRVNEKINAEKRNYINGLIDSRVMLNELTPANIGQWAKKIQMIMLDLMESQKIILYENNLSLEGNTPQQGESPREFFKRILSIFLASGKIDIHSDMHVTFTGDKRVLADLEILAKNGYGEDKYGNNIMLPPKLPYLKR